jgi:4-hydroxythreonine-4-phosphate dehydrogenase
MENKVKVGISCGDPNGVGMEVVIKALADNRLLDFIIPVLYAHPEWIKATKKSIRMDEWMYTNVASAREAQPKKINLVTVSKDMPFSIEWGKADIKAGEWAYKSLEMAAQDLANNTIDVLVTAPINKETIQSKHAGFIGHTEYLAKMAGTEEVLMFLVADDLRVGIVTGHIPIKDVASKITKEAIIKKVKMMRDSLIKDFGIPSPRIAVLGLNPHAGDNGMLGSEEKEVIQPAVRELVDKGMMVYGPFGADGFFGSGAYRQFDAVLAMYHDQGLAPFKTMAFQNGVNFTAGLPIVRTSPDHGVGYDIAGKNQADESSLRASIYTACDVYHARKLFKEYGLNPLQKQSIKESRDDKRE